MRCLAAVAEHLNFTKAANHLCLTQSAVSYQVAALEREVGVQIFHRAPNSVRFTPEGQHFWEGVKGLLSTYDALVASTRHLAAGGVRNLAVGFLGGPEKAFLPSLVRRFRKDQPQTSVRVNRYDMVPLSDALVKGDLDVAFTLAIALPRDPALRSQMLYRERLVAVMAADHPLAGKESIAFDDLRGLPFVDLLRPLNAPAIDVLVDICLRHGFAPRVVERFPDLDSLFLAVESGEGVAVFPKYRGDEHLNARLDLCAAGGRGEHHRRRGGLEGGQSQPGPAALPQGARNPPASPVSGPILTGSASGMWHHGEVRTPPRDSQGPMEPPFRIWPLRGPNDLGRYAGPCSPTATATRRSSSSPRARAGTASTGRTPSWKGPTCCWWPRGRSTRSPPLPGTRGWVLEFSPAFLPQATSVVFSHFFVLSNVPLDDAADRRQIDALCALMEDLQARGEDRGPTLAHLLMALLSICQALLLKASAGGGNQHAGDFALFQDFMLLVDAHFRTEKNLGFYARHLKINPRRLAKLCRENLGRTPLAVLEERTVIEAKRLLAQTDLAAKEVAFQLGFEDPSYFTKVFRKITGSTPLAFRKDLEPAQ